MLLLLKKKHRSLSINSCACLMKFCINYKNDISQDHPNALVAMTVSSCNPVNLNGLKVIQRTFLPSTSGFPLGEKNEW